jgi:hypothetical protein
LWPFATAGNRIAGGQLRKSGLIGLSAGDNRQWRRYRLVVASEREGFVIAAFEQLVPECGLPTATLQAAIRRPAAACAVLDGAYRQLGITRGEQTLVGR